MLGKKSAWMAAAIVLAAVSLVGVWPREVGGYVKRCFFTGRSTAPDEIVVWHAWGGRTKEQLENIVEVFRRTHPEMKVTLVFAPNGAGIGGGNQKFFTAVSAGKAPDVVFVDSSQVAEWASQGALMPLDNMLKASSISEQDFFAPCWKSTNYNGHTWAMTFNADPNFAFAWNKEVFAKAGLDPEKPPRTFEELDSFAERCTKIEGGKMLCLGVLPWAQFGTSNSMYTWGWAFGGEFYDEKTRKVTANHPRNVEALKWMVSYAKKFDVNRISGFSQGFGSLDRQPFYTGELAMTCFHVMQIDDATIYAKDLKYGLVPIPCPPGGEKNSSWIGGWCMGIPKGVPNPKLSWEFIRWMTADAQGTLNVGKLGSVFPGYRKSPYFDEIRKDPRFAIYVDILNQSRHQRPVMPAVDYYCGALDRAVSMAIYGLKTPQQALDDATAETQRELDFKLAGEK